MYPRLSLAKNFSAKRGRVALTGLSVVSGLRAVREMAAFVADPLMASRKIEKRFGPAVALTMGSKRVLFHFTRHEFAEDVLRHHKRFYSGPIIVRGKTGCPHNALRHNFLNANGKEYDHYVKLFGPLFKRKTFDAAAKTIFETVNEELDQWQTGQTIEMTTALARLSKLMALRALYLDDETATGLQAADLIEQHGRLSALSPRAFVWALSGYAKSNRLSRHAEKTHAAICAWGEMHRGMPNDHDVMAAIVNAPDETGAPADDDRIAGYGWMMLGAAFDTSSSALCWLLVFLALHPDVAVRLHDELRTADVDIETDMAGLMRLPYLDAVVNEAMRLVPPVPFQRRRAMAHMPVGGIIVPRRAHVYVSGWMVNRDERLYPQPDSFRPERWETINPTPYQWLPFSAGPRRCLGIWFGYGFVKAALAAILMRWRPQIPDGTKIGMKVAITVRPVPGLPVLLHPQDQQFRKAKLRGNFL